ncbi:MAG TPA: DsbA family oxidoreductase [Rhodospirillales bacterium]|nr:DsbA family oxidoreductase [Rhodospirillales bacterium]
MEIDFIFDASCPWSYIGKQRLDQAIAERPAVSARIKWVPFLLNPEVSQQGADRNTYLTTKFGSESRIRRMHETLVVAGKAADIVFNFDLIDRVPSTLRAHRLIQMADLAETGGEAVEQIFRSYFHDGQDIGDPAVLLDIAERIGLDPGDIARRLQSDEFSDLVYRENARAHRLGINGVPSFACNGSMVISGAQGTKILTRVIDAAVAEMKIGRVGASFS